MTKSTGKSHRKGMRLIAMTEMFPDGESAIKWFESVRWPDSQKCCGHCGSKSFKKRSSREADSLLIKDCRSYFSVRTGTNIEKSRLPLRKWIFAIYLFVTHLKGVSSMTLHRDLKVTQKTAWFMCTGSGNRGRTRVCINLQNRLRSTKPTSAAGAGTCQCHAQGTYRTQQSGQNSYYRRKRPVNQKVCRRSGENHRQSHATRFR